jgi:hypothetical protein
VLDAYDETLPDAPPEESERRFRDELGAWLSEHPNEFWYHVALRLARALLLAQQKNPERTAIAIDWEKLTSASRQFALKVGTRWRGAQSPSVVVRVERIDPELGLLHHGPPDRYDLEPD